MIRGGIFLILACTLLLAQTDQPTYPLLDEAYKLLNRRQYDDAIDLFRQVIEMSPERVEIRKDLAYALLKVGENEAARDQFGEAMKLDPDDHHVALEYAFLCFETGEKVAARRVFDRVRKTGDTESRATAETAFQNINLPLRNGIARWTKVVQEHPGNYSAQKELARLAEQADELELAATHYEHAWRLRPNRTELLLDLGRVWKESGETERSIAALLAASRGAEPRVAERARSLLPERYPYVYEFEQALELTPGNTELRRELAYLHLAMDQNDAAERQFAIVHQQAPDDVLSAAQLGFLLLARKDYDRAMPLLRQVLDSDDKVLAERVRGALNLPQDLDKPRESPKAKVSVEPKVLAERSLQKGYLNDAMKYLSFAHETDPVDFAVMLDLGRTSNILKRDDEAIRWFDLARRSPDPKIAGEAQQSYKNLKPDFKRFRTTFWVMPFFSSRWQDLFAYSQIKTEIRLRSLPIRPYISVRFAGDARRTAGSIAPQYLSESSFIVGVGLRTKVWNGAFAWLEAGSDISYLDRTDRAGRMAPDYRGGVSLGRGWGHPLGGEAPGGFFDTYNDGVFMSRFSNTFIASTRNRFGYTTATLEKLGGFQPQFYWNGSVNLDAKSQAWANFVETGPGLRFRWKGMPRSLVFSIDLLQGFYLIDGNPRGQKYTDIRAGFWYAFSR